MVVCVMKLYIHQADLCKPGSDRRQPAQDDRSPVFKSIFDIFPEICVRRISSSLINSNAQG